MAATPSWHRKIAQAGADFLPPSSACVVRIGATNVAEVVTRYYTSSPGATARAKAHTQVTRLSHREPAANFYVVTRSSWGVLDTISVYAAPETVLYCQSADGRVSR